MSRRSPNPASLGRERRHQASVSIRKRGRDTRVAAERTAGNNPVELPISREELESLKRFGIPQLVEDFRSGTSAIVRATMATRKLLANEKENNNDGLVDKMIALGLVDHLGLALDRNDSPRLQFEALWGITNCSVLRPEVVIRIGALPKIVHLLDASTVFLKEQALWSVGNIMSKSSAYRNQCLALGALQRVRLALHLAYNMSNEEYEKFAKASQAPDALKEAMVGVTPVPVSRLNFIRQATWAMSNAIRGADVDDEVLSEVTMSLQILRDLVVNYDEPNMLANVMWTIADFAERKPRLVLEMGITDRVIELALHPHDVIQGAAAQCISNLCTNDGQCLRACVVSRRADLVLLSHLRSERFNLWANASWTISFICSEIPEICDRLLIQCDIVLELFANHMVASEVRQDCAAIISACFSTERGCAMLRSSDKILSAVLSALDEGLERDVDLVAKVVRCTINLLQRGGKVFAIAFEERGGFHRLRRIERALVGNPSDVASTTLHLLDNLDSLIDEWDQEDAYPSSPQRQVPTMIRNQPKGGGIMHRNTFQAFIKE